MILFYGIKSWESYRSSSDMVNILLSLVLYLIWFVYWTLWSIWSIFLQYVVRYGSDLISSPNYCLIIQTKKVSSPQSFKKLTLSYNEFIFSWVYFWILHFVHCCTLLFLFFFLFFFRSLLLFLDHLPICTSNYPCPAWCSSVGWASSRKVKGFWFDSQSGVNMGFHLSSCRMAGSHGFI